MILKRLQDALARQDWFAVCLEIVIVVVGVVLGFQVTAWGEEKEARTTEHELLQGLRTEFVQNRALFDESVAEHTRAIEFAKRLLRVTGPVPGELSDLALDTLIWHAVSIPPSYHPASGELDALLGAGQLGLIRNDRIRTGLASWPGVVATLNEVEQELRDDVSNTFYPYMLERAPFTTMDGTVGFLDVEPSRFERGYERLLADVAFENHVNNRWYLAERILERGEPVDSLLDDIIDRIDAELADGVGR